MSAIITHKIYEHPHSKGLESRLSRAAGLFQRSRICPVMKSEAREDKKMYWVINPVRIKPSVRWY